MSRYELPHLHVTIVSDNPETRDGLEAYLRRAGIKTNSTAAVDKLIASATNATAVVLFPDDFDRASFDAALNRLRSQLPGILAVVVTNRPQRYDGIPIVLPKPAWGWTILDAIRGYQGQ